MAEGVTTITLDELLRAIEAAKQRMSRANPHRLLFTQCQQALIQLATRVGEHSLSQEKDDAPPPEADAVGRIAEP